MFTRIEEVNDFLRACAERMQAIDDASGDESRDTPGPTDDERAEFAQLEEWVAAAVERKQRLQVIQDAVDAGGTPPAPAPYINRARDPFDTAELRFGTPVSELRAQAVTAIESHMDAPDSTRDKLTRLVEGSDNRRGDLSRHLLATGSPTYRDAFRTVLAQEPQTPEQQYALTEARTAIGTGTGFTLPITVDPTVLHIGDGSTNPMRQLATVRTVTTHTHQVNTLASSTFVFEAEAAESNDVTPADSTVSIAVEKAQGSVLYTIEAAQDIASLEADLRDAIAFAKDDLEAVKFINGAGSGSNEPQGVVTGLAGTAAEDDTATTATFVIADLWQTRNALAPRYRANASWLAEQTVYADIRQFDTAGGAGLWEYLGGDTPNQLIGKPVYESSAMDSDSTSSGSEILVYGDFAQGYRIVDRVGMSVLPFMHYNTNANLPDGTWGLYCYWRVGGGVTNVNAFSMLQVSA